MVASSERRPPRFGLQEPSRVAWWLSLSALGCVGTCLGWYCPLVTAPALLLVLFERCELMTKNHQTLRKVPGMKSKWFWRKPHCRNKREMFYFFLIVTSGQLSVHRWVDMCGMVIMHWNVTQWCEGLDGWWRLTHHTRWPFYIQICQDLSNINHKYFKYFFMGRRF